MIREEEILEAAKEFVFGDKPETSDFFDKVMIDSFCCGAKWADENPKEGLVSIDKVCEWWEQHVADYDLYDIWNKDYVSFKSLIMDFREAMEE